MSLYKNDITIGGIPCGMVLRGGENGCYTAIFEQEMASLEEIRGINWSKPEITGECVLPAGFGFTVADIRYSYSEDCYKVDLQVAEQYLGDVTGYQAELSALQTELDAAEEASAALTEQVTALTAQAAEAEAKAAEAEAKADEAEAAAAQAEERAEAAETRASEAEQASEERDEALMEAYQEGVESDG